MQNALEEFLFEYLYAPCPDADKQYAQAWDIISALILEDYENELQGVELSGDETC
jgi:hypothetical protein